MIKQSWVFLIVISMGIAMIIGVWAGNKYAIPKYYYYSTHEPVREITFEQYEEYAKDSHVNAQGKRVSDSMNMSVEYTFNRDQAISFGLTTLGIGLSLIGVCRILSSRKKPTATD